MYCWHSNGRADKNPISAHTYSSLLRIIFKFAKDFTVLRFRSSVTLEFCLIIYAPNERRVYVRVHLFAEILMILIVDFYALGQLRGLTS